MDKRERFRMDLGDFELLPEIKEVVTEEIKDELQEIEPKFQDLADIVGVSKERIPKRTVEANTSDKIFSFKGIKFTLDRNGNLSYRNKKNPNFEELFRLFNPNLDTIHFQKSRYSNFCCAVGHSNLFNTYCFVSGMEKNIFDSKKEAINYLKKFVRPRKTTNNTESLMWSIAQTRINRQMLQYFIELFGFECKINEHITVKLINKKSVIFVNNQEFMQCKFLLFTLDPSNINDYEEIESLDEAKEIYDKSMEGYDGLGSRFKINFMTEFWGHCSNLQVWAEHDYNSKLLEKTLAFPLLQELARVGDKKAIENLKFEVAERFETGSNNTRQYLINQDFLKHFSKDEFESLFRSVANNYENNEFWNKVEFSELYKSFREMGNRDTIFLYCPSHHKLANVFGDLGVNILSLNCGCELSDRHDNTRYEITIVKALR